MGPANIIDRSVDKNKMAKFLDSLDEKSRAIFWYLRWNRHADISALRQVGDITDDYDVLFRLKEVINCKALNIWGKQVASFEQSRYDLYTGQKVLFSWWYTGEDDAVDLATHSPLVDIFNEKDNVVIIAQLPAAVSLDDPEIKIKNGILRFKLKKIEIE
jgi:hypothetical protein